MCVYIYYINVEKNNLLFEKSGLSDHISTQDNTIDEAIFEST